MDDDLDELFGDDPPLQLLEPISKDLLQRVDESVLSGCCQKLAWSRVGCIAYITRQGFDVAVRNLMSDPYDGQWRMSGEYLADDVPTTHNKHRLVHLSWNHSGSELAILDVVGQVSVYAVINAINRLVLLRRCTPDSEDHLSAAVGMTWLHIDKPYVQSYFHNPMVRVEGRWAFTCSHQKLLGPRNPHQKPALVAITRSGAIKVLFQSQDNRWQDFKSDIDNFSRPAELLTHAAMCVEKITDGRSSEKESPMLLATCNSENELRLYRFRLDFEQKSIKLQYLQILTHFSPLDGYLEGVSINYDALPSHFQLSTLDLTPPGPKSTNRPATQASILASFLQVSDNPPGSSSHAVHSTVLCKWELETAAPRLHTCFNTLSSKKTNASSNLDLPRELHLKRTGDIAVPRTLISIHQLNMSTILALIYSDGWIEFRDKMTLKLLPPDKPNQISSLGQTGLNLSARRQCLHVALSPNACAVVSLDEQHLASVSFMQLEIEDADSLITEESMELINEALVMQSSLASLNQPSHVDDIIATLQLFSNQYLNSQTHLSQPPTLTDCNTFRSHYLSELYRLVGLHLDYTGDAPLHQLITSSIIQRCLSVQAALGYAGDIGGRSLSAIVAWTMLNTRSIALAFIQLVSKKPAGGENELGKPENLHLFVGLVSWTMSLIGYIVDEIFELGNLLEDQVGGAQSIDTNLLNSKIREINTPALLLLMTSSSRMFLRYICGPLKFLVQASKSHQGSVSLGPGYRELEAAFQRSPVTISQFEHLLLQVDTRIKSAYQSSAISTDDRGITEKEMLIKAEIPNVLLGPAKEILTSIAASLKEEVNVAELYFANTASLHLTNDQSSKRWRKEHPIDAMRKIEIRNDARTKKCTKCGAVMEDLLPHKGMNSIVINFHKHCFCGSWWMVGSEDEGNDQGF